MNDDSINRRIFVAGIVSAIAVGVVAGTRRGDAESDSSATPDASPQASPAAERMLVDITSFEFVPATVTIHSGTRVIWANRDGASHTVTADDGDFDSGSMRRGSRFGHTFDVPGRYPYFCLYHANMTGVVIVED